MDMEYDPNWGYPMPQTEQRQESSSFTDYQVQAQIDAATGYIADINATAAAEIAVGTWGRAFASAEIQPVNPATLAVTPEVLEVIGRELVRKGEALFKIDFRDGQFRLAPASFWTVYGRSYDSNHWRYRVSMTAPSGTQDFMLPSSRVLHFRYGNGPLSTSSGTSPFKQARYTSNLTAKLEQRLAEEMNAPVGGLIPVPSTKATDQLKADIARLKGKYALVETTASGWQDTERGAPTADWTPRRLGADPPPVLPDLRSEAARSMLAACGVPIELVIPSDGTGNREAWRRFLFETVAPAGLLIGAEMATKLDTPDLKVTWDELRASDLAGRARAFQSMVAAGMDVSKAAELSGLMVE